jgi:conjugative transposon TraN protein
MKKDILKIAALLGIFVSFTFEAVCQKKSGNQKPSDTKIEQVQPAPSLPVTELPQKPVESVLETSVSNAAKNELKTQQFSPENEITPIMVELAFNKTTSLIFPSAIRSVDLGSKSIIADKAINIENVLNVKAAQIGFNETNFSVITNDGRFYSFIVNYNEFPKSMAYMLSKYENKSTTAGKVDITFQDSNGEKMNEVVENIKKVGKKIGKDIVDANMYDVNFRITGLYVQGNTYYIKMLIVNKSEIDYDIDFVRYFLTDQKILKNTSNQEMEMVALATSEIPDAIKGESKAELVYAFNKFTIPNNKLVKVMLNEANGGRHLILNIDYDMILRAKKL